MLQKQFDKILSLCESMATSSNKELNIVIIDKENLDISFRIKNNTEYDFDYFTSDTSDEDREKLPSNSIYISHDPSYIICDCAYIEGYGKWFAHIENIGNTYSYDMLKSDDLKKVVEKHKIKVDLTELADLFNRINKEIKEGNM